MRATFNRITGRIQSTRTADLAYSMVSLVAAILVWIWVQNEQVTTERVRIRLDWKLPEGLLPIEKPLEAASASLEGVQIALRGAHQQDLSIALDLREASPGEVQVDLAESTIQGLPSGVRVISISPASMQLKFERALERKLPVAVASMGEVAPGYQLVKLEVEPRRMDVIGPISLMRTLTELSTEPLDLTGLSVDSRMKVGLELPAGVKLASGSTVDVLVDLEEQLSSRRLEAVQVKAGNYQPQSPVSLVLSGPVSVMEELDPSEVWVVVAVPEGLSSRQLKATPGIGPGLHYKVELPPGLKLEKVEPERIVLVPIKE